MSTREMRKLMGKTDGQEAYQKALEELADTKPK
jgi:hypothetical protein